MRYRNTKTGIEFTSNCAISGADFEVIGQKEAPKAEPKAEVKDEPKPKTTAKRTKK